MMFYIFKLRNEMIILWKYIDIFISKKYIDIFIYLHIYIYWCLVFIKLSVLIFLLFNNIIYKFQKFYRIFWLWFLYCLNWDYNEKLYSIGNLRYILIFFLIFYFGNWGNWNLIAKNIFPFIELIIAKIYFLEIKYIEKIYIKIK
jgi:hypothetical protein